VLALIALPAASALASPADISATRTYIQANYALLQVAGSHLKASEAAPLGVLRDVRRECPHAAAGSPQNEESAQLREEVIGAMVHVAIRPNLAAVRRFISATRSLRWSNRRLTRTIHDYGAKLQVLSTLRAPQLCADVRAWGANGWRSLGAATISYDARFVPAWVALGELPSMLGSYEQADERGMLKSSAQIEVRLTDGEARAVETWAAIMDELSLNM
jgi:hypothetical protein